MCKREREAEEIEVTPEMAAAGGREVMKFAWDAEDEKDAAARVYRKMAVLDDRRRPCRR